MAPHTTPKQREALRCAAEAALGDYRPSVDPSVLLDALDDLAAAEGARDALRQLVSPITGADDPPCIDAEAYEAAVAERDEATEAADRRLLQALAWQERAERAEAHLDTVKALVDEWLTSGMPPSRQAVAVPFAPDPVTQGKTTTTVRR